MKLLTENERPDLVELLLLLQEEAAEVSQAASKVIRFGLVSNYTDVPNRNVQELAKELTDILAVISLLCERTDIGITINGITDPEKIHAKLDKISKYTSFWDHANELDDIG